MLKKTIIVICIFVAIIIIVCADESTTPSDYYRYDDFDSAINATQWVDSTGMTWGASYGIGTNWSLGGVVSTNNTISRMHATENKTDNTFCVRMFDDLRKTPSAAYDGVTATDNPYSTTELFNGVNNAVDTTKYCSNDGYAWACNASRSKGWHDMCVYFRDAGNIQTFYVDGVMTRNESSHPLVSIGFYGTGFWRSTDNFKGLGMQYDVYRVWPGDYHDMPQAAAPPVGGSTCAWTGVGDWVINVSDNCTLNNATYLANDNLFIKGTNGHIIINSSIQAKSINLVPSKFDGTFVIERRPGSIFAAHK